MGKVVETGPQEEEQLVPMCECKDLRKQRVIRHNLGDVSMEIKIRD